MSTFPASRGSRFARVGFTVSRRDVKPKIRLRAELRFRQPLIFCSDALDRAVPASDGDEYGQEVFAKCVKRRQGSDAQAQARHAQERQKWEDGEKPQASDRNRPFGSAAERKESPETQKIEIAWPTCPLRSRRHAVLSLFANRAEVPGAAAGGEFPQWKAPLFCALARSAPFTGIAEHRSGLELGRQIAVDLKADADLDEGWGVPAHGRFLSSARVTDWPGIAAVP
jgi:hypothetical protein